MPSKLLPLGGEMVSVPPEFAELIIRLRLCPEAGVQIPACGKVAVCDPEIVKVT
jgi:hypothetical protein